MPAIGAVLGVLGLLAWVSFELLFRQPGESKSLAAGSTDRGSTYLLIAGYALAVIVPIALRGPAAGAWALIGVGAEAAGLAVRAWSMITLGTAYTRTLRTSTAQSLVTGGPYRWIRHPGYAGSLLVWTGAALAFGSWLAAGMVLLLMSGAYAWRIVNEERMLTARFGTEFRQYAARTSRLVPFIF